MGTSEDMSFEDGVTSEKYPEFNFRDEGLVRQTNDRKSISLLLGAGFSVPMGYPSGKELNEKILNYDDSNIAPNTDGTLAVNVKGEKPKFLSEGVMDSHLLEFEFCKRLIKLYNEKVEEQFDYEKFYDFIRSSEAKQPYYQDGCKGLYGKFGYEDSLRNVPYVFNQMVASLICDKCRRTWYDCGLTEDERNIYGCFLGIVEQWSKDYIIDVHTLNHDLLFETGLFAGEVSDGFDELGSNYFGKLASDKNHYVRLERYTERYVTPIRLYKLHGSLDYVLYNTDRESCLIPDKYVKIKSGMGYMDIYKFCNSEYEQFPFAYHGDFLTGTTSKTKRYDEPFYKNLFKKFENNLRNAEKLIIIGYGFKDSLIDDCIRKNFDYGNKPIYIVDPTPAGDVITFKNQTNAMLIEKSISTISPEDFRDDI